MRRKSDFLYIYCLCDPRDHSEKYIGQTNNLNRRFYEHLYEARTNNLTHKDKWINCLLKKSLFPEIKLIEKIDNTINIPLLNTIQKNIIDVNEELYVDKLKKLVGKSCTNIAAGGRQFSEKQKETIKLQNKKTALTRKKTLLKYDLEGNFLEEYLGLRDTVKKFNYNFVSLQFACTQKENYNTAYGYQWRYKTNENFPKYIGSPSKKYAAKVKSVSKYKLTGEFIKNYPSARSAEKDGHNAVLIIKTCLGEYSQHHGFKWIYNT